MSAPPSMPPGGTPPGYPPYDPKTQWRVYREQQRAAWRAQREAWKAQRHAWKAGYGSAYGPHVPSIVGPIILVGIGIVGLLIYSGRIAPSNFWTWYGPWWPILLMAASGWNGWWGPMRAQFGDHDDTNFFNLFGLPEHDQDQQLLNAQVPANAVVQIENPRGDVSVTASDSSTIEVQAHQVAFANSDNDARRIFDAEQAHVTVSGNTVLVKSESNNSGRLNLAVTVPKGAQVNINAGHGDVTAASLGAGATITSSHGDVHLSTIHGSVQVHFSNDRGDFSAHEIGGDITADGNCNDLTFSEIKGKVTLNGEIFGDVHLENVGGPIHLHTSVTELQLASLPGDLTLNSDDLRVTE